MRNPKSKEIRTLIKGSAVLRGMGEWESCGAGTELQGEGVGRGVLTMGPRRGPPFTGEERQRAERAVQRGGLSPAPPWMDGWMEEEWVCAGGMGGAGSSAFQRLQG